MSPLKINNNVVSIKKENIKPIKIEINLIEDKNIVNKNQESSITMNIKAEAKSVNNKAECQSSRSKKRERVKKKQQKIRDN
jgi:hypothetical protein